MINTYLLLLTLTFLSSTGGLSRRLVIGNIPSIFGISIYVSVSPAFLLVIGPSSPASSSSSSPALSATIKTMLKKRLNALWSKIIFVQLLYYAIKHNLCSIPVALLAQGNILHCIEIQFQLGQGDNLFVTQHKLLTPPLTASRLRTMYFYITVCRRKLYLG